jgi:Holliday junction resolvasome RuvABC DNA-binding subunit
LLSARTPAAEDAEALLHIHTHVRKDQIAQFGFAEPNEKRVFYKFLTISGIRPKLAISKLSPMATNVRSPANFVQTAIDCLLFS